MISEFENSNGTKLHTLKSSEKKEENKFKQNRTHKICVEFMFLFFIWLKMLFDYNYVSKASVGVN